MTAAEAKVRSAGAERGAAARLVTKKDGALKYANDKAATTQQQAEKAAGEAEAAEKEAQAKAYALDGAP